MFVLCYSLKKRLLLKRDLIFYSRYLSIFYNKLHRIKGSTNRNKEKKMKNKERNQKKTKKGFIIGGMCLFVVIALSVGGYFIYQELEFKKPIKEEWGEIYYQELKKQKEDKREDDKNKKNTKISFYEIEEKKDPVMVRTYEKEKKNYVDVYYMNDEKLVNRLSFLQPSEVEYLYKIEDKSYHYYIKMTDDAGEHYTTISDSIENMKDKKDQKEGFSYTTYDFKDGEEESVTDINGNSISISKFDKQFIKVEDKNKSIEYNLEDSDKKIKEVVTSSIANYQTQEEILDKVVKKVEKQLQEVLQKIEEMNKAQEEVEKKKEEELQKQKEEEAKKGLNLDGVTVKYGTYTGIDGAMGQTLVINSNQTATLSGANFGNGKTSENYTFKIEKHDFAQDISSSHVKTAIVFYNNGSVAFAVYPYNNLLSDGGISAYQYQGD